MMIPDTVTDRKRRSSSDAPFQLGPFAVERRIGRGGMGEIWQGSHADGVPVAIKVDLHPPEPRYEQAFLREVQLVAALDHPNVVMILDHGAIPPEVARDHDRLVSGARFLAMELAGGGSIAERPPRDWSEVLHLAQQLAAALAHAHSRGLVHLDIKPGNLLVAGPRHRPGARPRHLVDARIVLSDFGISVRTDTPMEDGKSVGTPQFMAPEQIEGRWRDYGPWTDLYAVGVLLWTFCAGHPFPFDRAVKLYHAHMVRPPPAFEPRFPVPDGLEELLRTLMEKAPSDRLAFAADLQIALSELGPPVGAPGDFEPVSDDHAPLDDAPTAVASPQDAPTQGRGRTLGGSTGPARWTPNTWRAGDRRAERNFLLEGAGLSLFGLRTVPLVGRVEERDGLWGAFVRVRADRTAGLVLLRGPGGAGKTRLAEWLAGRAHEVGAADTCRILHDAEGGAEHGLVRMLARTLKTDELFPHEVNSRIATLFAGTDVDIPVLAWILGGEPPEGRMRPTIPELHRLVARVLAVLAGDRSLVVVLDDAQWGQGSLEFVERVLDAQGSRNLPVLFVATVRDEALADRVAERELVEDLAFRDDVRSLVVGPLQDGERRELVRGLLGLDGQLASQVEETTEGNPQFAVQLVGSWIERGLLVASERGFRLAADATPELPKGLFEIWDARVDELLQRLSDADRRALEMAAVIGMDIREREWTGACTILGIQPTRSLRRALLRRHLAHAEDPGHWRFVHGLVRESLVRRCAPARWRDFNLAAGIHLREEHAEPHRLARHFVAAEAWHDAREPLETAAADQFDQGDFRTTRWVDQLQTAIEQIDLPESDAWWGRLWLLRAWHARRTRNAEHARDLADQTERLARKHGWGTELARALREAGRLAHAAGDFDHAITLLGEAEERFRERGDDARAADCCLSLGDIARDRGAFKRADMLYRSCIEAFERSDTDLLPHQPHLGLAVSARRQEDFERMRTHLDDVRTWAEKTGNTAVLATAANLEGEAARQAGDVELAEACYREAVDRYESIDDPKSTYPLLNLGLLMAARQAWAETTQRIRPLQQRVSAAGNQVLETFARAVLLPCDAALDDVRHVDAHLTHIEAFLKRTGMREKDIATLADAAGTQAAGHRRVELARRCWQIAHDQYSGLGNDEPAASVQARLDAL